MLKTTNFTNAGKSFTESLDKSFNLMNVALDSCKQVAAIQYNALHNFLADANEYVKQLNDVNSPVSAVAKFQNFSTKVLINNINSRKELLSIFANNKSLFSGLSSQALKDFQETLLKSTDSLSQVNPDFAKAANSALNAVIDKSNEVVATVAKFTDSVTESANKQFASATESVIKKANELSQTVKV